MFHSVFRRLRFNAAAINYTAKDAAIGSNKWPEALFKEKGSAFANAYAGKT